MGNPMNAGPDRDGSKSLAKESKAGALVQWAVTVAATGLLGWLANLDTSTWTGWWAGTAVAAVAAVTGLVTSYLKKNR
jgi:hypothetical protein